MTRDDLAAYQDEGTKTALFSRYSMCRRRFLRALDLLELRREQFRELVVVGQIEPVDLSPLVLSWRVLCCRYREEVLDPQTGLFINVATGDAKAWNRFIYYKLFPLLVRDDEFVCNVL